MPQPSSFRVAIIGGGPAGLMAAEVLGQAGVNVDLYDAMPSVGRKFLLAGVGGMNITHAEDYAAFVSRYAERAGDLRPLLDALGHAWGVTGSAGFQLATGLSAAHPDSDLDLLLRAERPLPRSEARPLLQLLEGRACRVDLQLETPLGGVALGEWAGGAARVLVKTAEGPRLVSDPWAAERAA